MNQQFHNKRIISDSHWRSPTNKPVWANYSTDQKKFTCHFFNIKLEEKLYKMSFKALPLKIQQSKNRQGVGDTKSKIRYSRTLREKCPNYGVFSGPYFPVFGLNTEVTSVSVLIQGNMDRKKLSIWTLFTQCHMCSS